MAGKQMMTAEELESKAVELLRKLVALKVYYTLNHPQAWQDAKEFLSKMPLPSPPKTK